MALHPQFPASPYHAWRASGYDGPSSTTKALLTHWFETEHLVENADNGDISEASSRKNKEELELLRKQSNEIDSWNSPYKAIVSVLMLKEGWDVKNVTAICGLRAYAAKSNIFREQTLGRWIIETKGREELDIPQKMARLKQWCEEATAAELEDGGNGTPYNFLHVDQDSFEKHAPKSLAYLAASFTEYKH